MEIQGASALEKIKKMGRAPFYVCHGEYEFLNKELAAGLVDFLLPDASDRAEGLLRFDWAEGEKQVDAWAVAAASPSLFGGNQLLIVDNANTPALRRRENPPAKSKEGDKFTNWETYSRFERAVESPLDGVATVFLCHDPLRETATLKGNRSDKFVQRTYPLLNERGVIVKFTKMYDNQMADWISRRVRERGMAISLENAELFLLHAGSDLRHLANEVDKLSVYLGDGADVSADDVRGVVTSSDDQYVWRIFDAAMDGRGNEALRLLEMSLKGSAEPLQIVASLGSTMRETWQARRLLDKGYFKRIGNSYNKMAVADELSKVSKADRDELAADGGIAKPSASAFKLFHAVRRAKRLPLDTIERIMQRLLDIDCKLKGIRRPLPGPEEIILQQLVADLAFVAKRGEGPTRHGRR